MKCQDIIEQLETLSPPSFAEGWDNTGLLAGRKEKEVKVIAVALDPSMEVIREAVEMQADMLITHHPLIFKPIKAVTTEDFIGRRLVKLLQNDISYYAMHTNFDIMGMSDAAADEISLQNRQVLEITFEDEISKEGIGRFGRLPRRMSLEECGELVKQAFGLKDVRAYGRLDALVERAAISPGSGADMIPYALEANADVLITGDIKHHDALDAMAQGLSIIDAGHFGIEQIFGSYLKEYFQREMPELQVMLIKESNPIQTI